MKHFLHRFGRFYSRVILNFIGIFIFVGILSAVFGDYGWIPNENIYAISQFVYRCVIPILIAYAAGNEIGHPPEGERADRHQMGGTIAVMAIVGVILADDRSGILGAMILGPICGLLWEKLLKEPVQKVKTGLEMLVRNIVAAAVGSILAVTAYYLAAPMLSSCTDALLSGINYLIGHKLIWLLSVIIEPAKVFFLNNSIHHGILLPLGMQQVEELGESILFLLEANPGPGLGLLTALYICRKEKRREYGASLFVEFIGGVHEVYFPEVLVNLWLLLALIGGGAAGNFCFLAFHGAVTGAVSPGSILSILLVCSRKGILSVLLGIFVSAAVSAVLTILILKWQERSEKNLYRAADDTGNKGGEGNGYKSWFYLQCRSRFQCDGGCVVTEKAAGNENRRGRGRGVSGGSASGRSDICCLPERFQRDVVIRAKGGKGVYSREPFEPK